jgi:pilus assembly protein FimV
MAPTREQVVQAAEKYVARGKIEPAIREYRKLLADHPNDINTLNRIGDLYARIQRIDEAVDFFTQIAEQYSAEGFFVKAIAIYKKIIKLDPSRLEVYEQLAELYHKQGLVNEARTQYQVLADYYVKHQNAASAIAIYQKMVELEPENPTYHVKLAEIYHQQQLVEKAMGEYRIIAELMLQHGRPQEAAQVYERALDIDSQNLGFIEDAVRKLRQADHAEGASHFLAAAVERNPQAEAIGRKLREPEKLERTGSHLAAPAAAAPARPALEIPAEAELEIEMDVEIDFGTAPEAARPGFGAILDEDDLDFSLGGEDDLARAMAEAAAAVGGDPAPMAGDPESDEIELDLGDVLDIDLPDIEDEPSSLVKPPADMLDAPARPAWSQAAAPVPGAAFAAPPPAPEEEPAAGGEIELDLDLDLSDPFASVDQDGWTSEPPPWLALAGEATEEPAAAVDDSADTGFIPFATVEEPATAAAQAEREDELDLVTEAEVLAKYGLEDKAVERLQEALRQQPDHLHAYTLLIQINLDKAHSAQVVELANRMAEAARRRGRTEPWEKVSRKLVEAGYRVDGDRVAAPQAARPAGMRAAERDDLLKSILGPSPKTPRAPAPPAAAPPPAAVIEPAAPPPPLEADFLESVFLEPDYFGLPDFVAEELPDARPAGELPGAFDAFDAFETSVPSPPAAAPAPAPPAPRSVVFDPLQIGELVESEAEDWSGLDVPVPMPAAPPQSVVQPLSSMLDDTGSMSWLDEADRHREEKREGGAEIFDEEDDFFDLAGELVEELSREEVFQRDGVTIQSEQSLEDIVEGFKKGVAEHLSPTDYDTHFNLGIAYREMGLLDEAIGEFQLAAKDASHLVLCCSMLGLCFLDKGLPDVAIKWYRRALATPNLSGEDQLGMLYDLGNVYLQLGDTTSAYDTFAELSGFDAGYRDVGEKLAELGAG